MTLAIISVALAILIYAFTFPVLNLFITYFIWLLTTDSQTLKGLVQRGKAKLHYKVIGNGAPVVLLHGGLSNQLSWLAQIPMLAKTDHQLILLDTRGHGKSSGGLSEPSYEKYTDDVICILDKLNIPVADIIGWSDGGNTALMLANLYPERVRRMIAISANYHPDGLTQAAQDENKKPYPWLKQLINRLWTQTGNNYEGLELKVKKLWSVAPQMNIGILKKISTPILLIYGEHDCITVTHAKNMEKVLPHAHLEIINDAGHSTPISDAGQVNHLIREFLDTQ